MAARVLSSSSYASYLSTASSTAAALARARFVDRQGATAEARPVESLDGARRVRRRRHLDERETARLPRDPVGDDRHVVDPAAVCGEQRPQLVRVAAVGEIPDVDLRGHGSTP